MWRKKGREGKQKVAWILAAATRPEEVVERDRDRRHRARARGRAGPGVEHTRLGGPAAEGHGELLLLRPALYVTGREGRRGEERRGRLWWG